MASGWQTKLTRISQMSWDEVRARLAQEAHKRVELTLHRIGVPPSSVAQKPLPSRKSQFIFSTAEIAERVELLRSSLPAEAAELLRRADSICRHRFDLLGYKNLDYGAEIDWHLDRVHGKRARLVPWFQIPFLEFAAVGDHKVTWELSRHQHLVTLAKVWLLTNDPKYLDELRSQWRSWIKANAYPLGINWGSTLEVAFRGLSWTWVDQLLKDEPGHSEFRAELLPHLAFHGRYIERYLSTYFSPNTHLLGEATALFFIGMLYPEFRPADRWRGTGWKIVVQEAHRQVRPDGVYFEQSLHYHVYALDFFLYARMLAARNEMVIPAEFDGTLQRMLDVLQALSQSGPPEGFGDDDGGRVFDPRRNQTEHMTDPLAIGAVLYGGRKYPAASLTEESIWLFGQRAVASLPHSGEGKETRSAAFLDGGIYVLAGSQPNPYAIVLDAGPQGIGRCGHGHADALSLRFTGDGRRWLVDSGSGVYISADPADRNAFRGTAAHNTMRVDGVDQAVPGDPFSWSEIPTTRVDNWQTGHTFSYFVGSHDGYARLADPVTHSRSVVNIDGGPCLVRDAALGKQDHDVEVLWHLASDLDVQTVGGNIVRASRACPDQAQENAPGSARAPSLMLMISESTAWKLDATRGLISPAYGSLQPAPVIRAHARATLPTEFATLFLFGRASGQNDLPRLVSMSHAAVQVYELAEQDANHGFCFALDKRPWSFGPWFSDAEFLYCRIEADKLTQLLVIGGTCVSWQGQPLLKAPGPWSFFEWRQRGGVLNSERDSLTLSPLFYELTGSANRAGEPSNASYAEKP